MGVMCMHDRDVRIRDIQRRAVATLQRDKQYHCDFMTGLHAHSHAQAQLAQKMVPFVQSNTPGGSLLVSADS